MNIKGKLESILAQRAMSDIDADLPGPKYEVVPHVIPIEITVNQSGICTYQTIIPMAELPHGFLLERINTRQNTELLRIRQGTKMYYSAPGWLHYVHHDVALCPALFMENSDWHIDVMFSWYLQTDVKQLQIALIGQRVIKL